MNLKRVVWIAFVVGALVAGLGISTDMPTPGWVHVVFAEWLSAPGVLITLPLHNLVAAWWWPLAVIALGNGLVYGAVAAGVATLWRRLRN